LLNNIDPAIITNVVANQTVTIEGYGELTVAGQIASHKTCAAAETPGEYEIDVAIPTSCECPYEWCLTVVCKPNLKLYEVQTTFPANRVYCYEDPAGGTPTATATAAAIAAQINADPFACVTASVIGTVITLVGKPGVCFEAYTASGTVTETVPYVAAILDAETMCRLFPIKWGAQGSKPNIPVQGEDYCVYCFTIRNDQIQDVDGANHWNDYEKEVCFYVRANDPNFAAFDTPVAGLIPVANGGTLP
jgi:hypothetical protein